MRVSPEKMAENAGAIENYIDEYYEMNGISPCIEVIAAETGISKSTVGRYLQKMTDEGRLISNGKRGYEIIRRCWDDPGKDERRTLDLTWRNLPVYGESEENAIAVIDGSGSMTFKCHDNVSPSDVAQSLGIYFAEHNKGAFANHFITFSMYPQLVEIKGRDIVAKARYCESFDEAANTDLEAVFRLILNTAVKNNLPQSELPSKLFIISDMEFDSCIEGGNHQPLYDEMRSMHANAGYQLPQIVFWNVNSIFKRSYRVHNCRR